MKRKKRKKNCWASRLGLMAAALSTFVLSTAVLSIMMPVSAHAQSAPGAATRQSSTTAAPSGAVLGKLGKVDRDFMRQLAFANIAEIETAKLAQSRSRNDEVRRFAQKMVDDHTRALDELTRLAESKGVQLPTRPDRKHQAMAKKLTALPDPQFDKQYLRQAGLRDHREAHRLAQRVSTRAKDPELKAYAEKMSPAIEAHLKSAEQMSGARQQETSGK